MLNKKNETVEKQKKEKTPKKTDMVSTEKSSIEMDSQEMDRIVDEVIRDFQSDIEYLKDK